MSQSDREAIKARIKAQLDAMDEPTRRATIRVTQARLLLITARGRPGLRWRTKEQIQHALDEMRKTVND